MSSSTKDKLESDAQRAKSRGFGGYLKDRLTGSADFAASKASADAKAAPGVIGSKNPANKAALEAAGYKKGGAVKAKPSNKTCW